MYIKINYLEQLHQPSNVAGLHMSRLRGGIICHSLLNVQAIVLFEFITSANGSDETGSADLETPSLLFKFLITRYLFADFLEKQFNLLTQAHI
jgi:hypothetical protein